jgi:hypothetical protein
VEYAWSGHRIGGVSWYWGHDLDSRGNQGQRQREKTRRAIVKKIKKVQRREEKRGEKKRR